MSDVEIPLVIIGGGIIGMSLAYELLDKNSLDFCILDKEQYLGEHSSGRNSGVLHAGLYYPKNSYKKKFCIEGLSLWKDFCHRHNLYHNNCGKFIFTKNKFAAELESLFTKAKENGAKVRMSTKDEVEKLKSFCNLDTAFFSPNTSIVDPSELISFFRRYLESKDLPILLKHNVTDIKKENDKFVITVNDYKIKCNYLINAAGHGGVGLRSFLGLNDLENYFVKGHYIKTNKKFFNESLLYPLPEKNLKGLGVHTCIDSDGQIKFGPDTSDIDKLSYSMDSDAIESMKQEVLNYFHIDSNSLHADYAGIRPKLIHNDQVYRDFWIKSPIQNYIELLGIESPGLTSSLSIAKFIIDKYEIQL